MAQGVHPVDPDKFSEACEKYINGRCSQKEAAEIAGMSIPTFLKYLNILFTGGVFPDNLFGKKKKK